MKSVYKYFAMALIGGALGGFATYEGTMHFGIPSNEVVNVINQIVSKN